MVERAVLTSPHDELTPADFQSQPENSLVSQLTTSPLPGSLTLEALEEQAIRQSVAQHRGNLSQVARALGLSRGALYRRLDKFGIPYSE
jgi:DNA-binding NtrC family response regulator